MWYPPGYGQPVPGKRRRRWLRPVLVTLLVVPLLLSGYLLLTYNRSVGAAPIADPVPEQCQVSAEVLRSAGAPSWQGGPMSMSGEVQGVTCNWVAAEAESVRQRRLTATVNRHPSGPAAKKQVLTRANGLGDGTTEQDGVGEQAVVWSSDGIVTLVARRGPVVVTVEISGADKSFFSGLLGDDVKSEPPAAQLREQAIAVARELVALIP